MSTEENKEQWRNKQSIYYENNREKWNEYQKEYKKRKYNEDPEYRARMKEYSRQLRLKKKNQQKFDNA